MGNEIHSKEMKKKNVKTKTAWNEIREQKQNKQTIVVIMKKRPAVACKSIAFLKIYGKISTCFIANN